MPWLFKKLKKVNAVYQMDGPTSAGGATMNVYVYEDESIETEEYDWFGRSIARYAGEPREVPPGTTMPPAPPRPAGAAPLPYVPAPMPPTPRAPLEPALPQQPPPPSQRRSSQ